MSRGPTCRLFKRKRRGRESRTYYAEIGLAGEQPKTVNLRIRDKEAARSEAAKLLKELEQERHGVAPRRAVRETLAADLTDLFKEHCSNLAVSGIDADHVYNVRNCLRIVASDLGWKRWSDVSAVGFKAWRVKRGDAAPKTLNAYLSAWNGLGKSLKDDGRIPVNAFEDVGNVRVKGVKPRRKRRALYSAEQSNLLSVAGPRRPPYHTALVTGLRRAELESLRVIDVDLVRMRVRAAEWTTKNGDEAWQVITPELAAELAPLVDGRDGGAPLFVDGVPSVEELKTDLDAAGIPFETVRGRVDFHALRHTYISTLKATSAPPRLVQEMARHSDGALTEGYTDLAVIVPGQGGQWLPRFPNVANGTKGTGIRTGPLDADGRMRTQADAAGADVVATQVLECHPVGRILTHTDASGRGPEKNSPTRTRT